MKLIFCPKCEDIVKLDYSLRLCKCSSSWGHYHADGLHASIGGEAIPIGFNNSSFLKALHDQPQVGYGQYFEAFVIPKDSPRIRREK